MQFTTMTDEFAGQAGRLFAERYERLCKAEPALNPTLDPVATNAEFVAGRVKEWAAAGASVVAHENGVLRGYMAGRFIPFFHAPKALYIPEWASAADSANPERLLRHMYAWLTRSGQVAGSTVHTITAFASDDPAISALSSMGFGVHLNDAVRTTQSDGLQGNPSVRPATEADIERLSALDRSLYFHLSQPPVYLPTHTDDFDPAQLPGPGTYTNVAEVDGAVVGFMSCKLGEQEARCLQNDSIPHINGAFIEPDHRGGPLATALLDDLLAWARDRSADRITVDFETANVEGAGFWPGSAGFKPVLKGLVRTIAG